VSMSLISEEIESLLSETLRLAQRKSASKTRFDFLNSLSLFFDILELNSGL